MVSALKSIALQWFSGWRGQGILPWVSGLLGTGAAGQHAQRDMVAVGRQHFAWRSRWTHPAFPTWSCWEATSWLQCPDDTTSSGAPRGTWNKNTDQREPDTESAGCRPLHVGPQKRQNCQAAGIHVPLPWAWGSVEGTATGPLGADSALCLQLGLTSQVGSVYKMSAS